MELKTSMSTKEENLHAYREYNKTLRAWLVGFGFGVPALFIINQSAQNRLLKDSNAELIQVVMAFLNKIIAWCSYYKHGKDEATIFCVLRLFTAMENWFFIDIIFDVVSLITFGWSIVLIMHLFITT